MSLVLTHSLNSACTGHSGDDVETHTCSYCPSCLCWILFWRRFQAFSTFKIKEWWGNYCKNTVFLYYRVKVFHVMQMWRPYTDDMMSVLTCFCVTSVSHSVLRTTLACSTCLALDHWLCSRRRASSVLTPSRSVILDTAWEGKQEEAGGVGECFWCIFC